MNVHRQLPHVMLITDQWERVGFETDKMRLDSVHSGTVPTPGEIANADLVIIYGPLRNAERAFELAGAIKLAVEHGATIAYLHGARFEDIDRRFVSEFGQIAAQQVTGSVRAAASEPPPHPAFREFMTLHGHTDQRFTVLPESVEVLAHAVVAESPYDAAPTAIRIEIANGSLYILPHHTAGNIQVLLERITEAVLEHREGALAALPPFFDELLLPGEENVVREIEGTQAALERLEGERAALTRHKLLVGHSSGGQLERLVIEELNLVLAGSGVAARDVEERGVEDFELVDGAGMRKAIAESKAAGGGVTLGHVNQINSHRSELFDAAADELPGLLIVNTFRNDEVLERRRREPVNERVVRHARRMNVLVLRSWDLYRLVARRLGGEDDTETLIAALAGGGGWVEVTDETVLHHVGE